MLTCESMEGGGGVEEMTQQATFLAAGFKLSPDNMYTTTPPAVLASFSGCLPSAR